MLATAQNFACNMYFLIFFLREPAIFEGARLPHFCGHCHCITAIDSNVSRVY